jgi:hypothetical protein
MGPATATKRALLHLLCNRERFRTSSAGACEQGLGTNTTGLATKLGRERSSRRPVKMPGRKTGNRRGLKLLVQGVEVTGASSWA